MRVVVDLACESDVGRRTLFQSVAGALVMAAFPSIAQQSARIPLAQLQAMFKDMRAKTRWDVDGPLLWSYFFLDPSEAALQRLSSELATSGYRVVGIERVEGSLTRRLHVEKVEAHTPMSLHYRNDELYGLAAKHGVAAYDGMDVGPVPAVQR